MKREVAMCLLLVFAGYAQAKEQTETDKSSVKPVGVVSVNSFKECTAVSLWQHSGKSINNWVDSSKENDQLESTVKIPNGWSVVGAGSTGQNREPVIFICH